MAPSTRAAIIDDDEVIAGRKKLIEETRKFKQLDDQVKLSELPNLLKLYHQEIDGLVLRCKEQNNIILKMQQENEQVNSQEIEELRKEKDQLAIELANAHYDLETANLSIEEKQRRIEEFESNLLPLSTSSSNYESEEFKQIKSEYNKAIEQIANLKNRISENEHLITSLQAVKPVQLENQNVQELKDIIENLEFRLEADNQQHQRELDQAVLKERFKWESILALEKQQKSNQIQDKQVEILQQQLQTERKEKSRLEADNLILVERLRQNMNRKNSVKAADPETGALTALRQVAIGTRLILWGSTSGSALKRAFILAYMSIIHLLLISMTKLKRRHLRTIYGDCMSMTAKFELNEHKAYFDRVFISFKEPETKLSFQVTTSMPSLMSRVITKLLSENSMNVLVHGVKLSDTKKLVSNCPNPAHMILCEDPWEWLLSVLGERRVFVMLAEATIFISREDGLCMQICGYPLSELTLTKALNQTNKMMKLKTVPSAKSIVIYRAGRFGLPKEGLKLAIDKTRVLSRRQHIFLLNYYCPSRRQRGIETIKAAQNYHNVARFVFACVKIVFKKYLNRKLKTIIRRHIHTYIRLRRFERMRGDAEWILAGVKVKELPSPLEPFKTAIEYIFSDFISRILAASFYITDTFASRYTLTHIRLDDWSRGIQVYKKRLLETNLKPIGYYSKQTDSTLGRLRFLPKEVEGSFRPIINMKSINNQNSVKNALAVLEYHKRALGTEGVGASIVGGMTDIKNRIEAFKSKFPNGTTFHFGKVDVEKCFDRIPVDRLVELIERLINKPKYQIYRHDSVNLMGEGEVAKRFFRMASPVGSVPTSYNRSGIIIDRCSSSSPIDRSSVISAIKEAICNVRVHHDGIVYALKAGIPQGSSLSSILCALFYSDLDKKHLQRWLEDDSVLMMRYVDDMIVISPNENKVSQLIDIISQGFPEYGFSVNQAKTMRSAPNVLFPWCGLFLSPYLDVSVDYSKVIAAKISENMNIEFVNQPGRALQRFVRTSLKPRLQRIVFSKSNQQETNLSNLGDISALLALRIMSFVKEHDRVNRHFPMQPRTIQKAFCKGAKIISRSLHGMISMPVKTTLSIYYNTIHRVMRKHQFKHRKQIILEKYTKYKQTRYECDSRLMTSVLNGGTRL